MHTWCLGLAWLTEHFGLSLALVFEKASLRTRTTFELAAQRLSADLRWVVVGGDWIPTDLPQRLRRRSVPPSRASRSSCI